VELDAFARECARGLNARVPPAVVDSRLSNPRFDLTLAEAFRDLFLAVASYCQTKRPGLIKRIWLSKVFREELLVLGHRKEFAKEVTLALAGRLAVEGKRGADPRPPPVVSLPPRNLTAIRECRYGRMLYLRNDMYVGRSLDLYGEYSEGEAALFRQLVSPSDIVVEVGANFGAHTVCLARAVGTNGTVIAFEPQRFVFQILCANIALNELLNVQARFAAAGSTAGTILVPALDFGALNNFGGVSLGGPGGERVSVETIDGLRLDRLRLLKVDVEGMEAEVLAGAAETIMRCRPVLYVENDREEKSAALIRMIREFRYRMWWHVPPLFNPENFAGNRENVFLNIVSANMLCFPEETEITVPNLREVSGLGNHPSAEVRVGTADMGRSPS